MAKYTLDMDKYAALARQAAAEGCVLLKNEDNTLPLAKNTRVSVFGRIAFTYYKSGTGSGGLVNTTYVTGILDALKKQEDILVNEELVSIYEEWIKDHPFNKGAGWGQEPWSQEEMPLTDDIVAKAASASDAALVVIGRTAGEDQDTKVAEGSYLLTKTEEDMLEKVCRSFSKVAVILNVGNIIDMKWVHTYNPGAVLYVWQGGQEGGDGVFDVLTGKVNPCGKLTDTIAWDINDYPSTKNFGDDFENIYQEDIYVGYRYFETFAKDKVMYPFGFGLSYTTFDIQAKSFEEAGDCIKAHVCVTNTGSCKGKEVIQLYVSAPQGILGKPALELKAYDKTKELLPGESQSLCLCISKASLASYDDGGYTGHKSCFVLEAGTYQIYVGNSVRNTVPAGSFSVKETYVTEALEEALAPVKAFDRFKPVVKDGTFTLGSEPAPLRTIQPLSRRDQEKPADIPYTGDAGYKLADVYDGTIDMDTFIAQLSDEDLTYIIRGEGMCSPKVTPGTAGAFGGLTPSLQHFGIPAGCCADGPSGIRMDCGTTAFAMPNGTCLGCTFNIELVQELYQMEGMELRKNKIDTLLGPGINIHRNPLNGRNFEYISEDPYVTGTMAAAQVKGMGYAGVTGTVKHFACNNQEHHRRFSNAVVSERALREIYLKGFEMSVKDGGAYSIMTAYGGINGIWCAGNYDLNTTILRNQWGFKGLVMTDWWAEMNEEGEKSSFKNTGIMVRSQNDLFMVTQDAENNSMGDTAYEALTQGRTSRGEFQRCAANICHMLMRSPVMDRYLGRTPEDDLEIIGDQEGSFDFGTNVTYHEVGTDTAVDMSEIDTSIGRTEVFGLTMKEFGLYHLTARLKASAGTAELAQLSVSVFYDNHLKGMFNISGADKEWQEQTIDLGPVFGPTHYMKLYFSMSGMELESFRFTKTGDLKNPFEMKED
ncbi:MAG TPA: glycoside hydrolase family 3 protein [Candidatus Scybalocola faecigallinarum]|uniref:Glycoside hydrolase family 3 protein n=1 Tax=Candidatus Scybalocola faecigallinarum TaxID=2840941 RepID=A0A9D1F5Y9_9FIRM|nr:glycoside hydrolase family 3 protein [Candidatus Scybalocola faecigallinarum]